MNNHSSNCVACVLVTYNRKELLKRCLDAVASQTFKPHTVFITDNASTDGTIDSVKEWGYYECERNGIHYKYILNSKNEGGAGGFYLGIKTAHEKGIFNGIWVMDDDGEPDSNCLSELQKYLGVYDYISPLVLSDADHFTCAFFNNETKETISNQAKDGVLYNKANPFNGILFSNKLIETIGYPKKEMFIWGDEYNYTIRAKNSNYYPVTIIKALHYHPLDRQKRTTGIFGSEVIVINLDWKMFCFCRNLSYNLTIEHGKIKSLYWIFIQVFKYSVYCMKEKKYNLWVVMLKAFYKGYNGNFNGLEKYLKK